MSQCTLLKRMSDHLERADTFWEWVLEDPWADANRQPETYHGLTQKQQVLFNAAYEPPRGDTGGSYPFDEKDLDRVFRLPVPNPVERKVSVREAASDIIDDNSTPRRLNSTERQTLRDLDKYLFNRVSMRPEDIPSLIFKAFKDLDAMLFGSYLFGRVHVRWLGARLMQSVLPGDNTHLRGVTTGKRWGSRIDLSIDTLLLRSGGDSRYTMKENVLVTLLHEMVHAYFQLRCHHNDLQIGHDNAYWCALEAVAIHLEEEFGFSPLHEHCDEAYFGE